MRITIWMSITLIYMCHHLNSYPQCVNNCPYINVRVSLWCLTHHWSSSRGLSSTDRIKKIKLHNILNLLHQPQFYWWDLWKNRNNRWTMRRRQNFRRRWSPLLLLLHLLHRRQIRAPSLGALPPKKQSKRLKYPAYNGVPRVLQFLHHSEVKEGTNRTQFKNKKGPNINNPKTKPLLFTGPKYKWTFIDSQKMDPATPIEVSRGPLSLHAAIEKEIQSFLQWMRINFTCCCSSMIAYSV